MTGIEQIYDADKNLLAIIVPHHYDAPGITFVTPPGLSQQLAFIKHPANHVIAAHMHSSTTRIIHMVQETLFMKRGRLRVDFYDDKQTYVGSRVIRAGDALLLVSGGHGFVALDEVEFFEVKQGPYVAMDDKVRFPAIADEAVRTVGVVEWSREHARF